MNLQITKGLLLLLLLLSRFSHVRLCATPQMAAHQAPPSLGFSRQNTAVGCHFLLQRVKVKSLSHVPLLATPWTAAHQAPPSMGFSRQEYWNGVPLPSPIKGLGEIKKNSFHFPKMKIKAPLFCVLSIIQDNSG